MTLQPGGSSSDKPENEHPRSEQWLLVISGTGRARVSSRTVSLRARSLLLIEKGEPHQITNTGRAPLVTLNFYSPPAYRKDGKLLRWDRDEIATKQKRWRPVGNPVASRECHFATHVDVQGFESSTSANAKPQDARNARVVDRSWWSVVAASTCRFASDRLHGANRKMKKTRRPRFDSAAWRECPLFAVIRSLPG